MRMQNRFCWRRSSRFEYVGVFCRQGILQNCMLLTERSEGISYSIHLIWLLSYIVFFSDVEAQVFATILLLSTSFLI